MDVTDFINFKRTRRFQIEISFEGLRGRATLGTVSVYADTELEAFEIARDHTIYTLKGSDKLSSQVRETAPIYGRIMA